MYQEADKRWTATATIYHISLFLRQTVRRPMPASAGQTHELRQKKKRTIQGGRSLLNARFFKHSDRKGGLCERTI
jgi:hypothetical protein